MPPAIGYRRHVLAVMGLPEVQFRREDVSIAVAEREIPLALPQKRTAGILVTTTAQ
jgi:hypothetical protein